MTKGSKIALHATVWLGQSHGKVYWLLQLSAASARIEYLQAGVCRAFACTDLTRVFLLTVHSIVGWGLWYCRLRGLAA